MSSEEVRETRSGLYVRHDADCGLLVYSPYSGLVFEIPESEGSDVVDWLEGKRECAPISDYEHSLGAGWFVPCEDAWYPMSHLLAASGDTWDLVPIPRWPIVINWLLTGVCPLSCRYCDATDLMHNGEPTASDIDDIVSAILSLRPLAVVLTGGEPLASPHLVTVIQELHHRVGIIIDTNAYLLKPDHLALFKQCNVAVRISFDSEQPWINEFLRPACRTSRSQRHSSESTVAVAVRGLCECLDKGISVSVQSVATHPRGNDLVPLGDKLYRLGVRSWRVLKVQPSQERLEQYRKLVGPRDRQTKFYDHIFEQLVTAYEPVEATDGPASYSQPCAKCGRPRVA